MHEDIVKYAWRNVKHAKKKFNIIYTKKLNKYVILFEIRSKLHKKHRIYLYINK